MPSNPFEYANGMRDKITAKESQEIQQMYVELGKKIDALGKKYGKKETASAPLQQMYYTQLKKQVEAWSKELSNGVYSKVTHAIGSVSDAVVEDNAKWLESLGFNKGHISAAFSNVNQSVVNSIVTGKIYGGKSGSWSLSKSIWGDNEKNLKTIYRIVAEGMTMQMGVQEIAENLRDFVDPTKKLDWTGPDGIKIYGRKTDYNAQRLVRTLSQHAYQKSVSQVAWDNPFISKIKWIANGSRVCEICKKRNGKVYALSKLPLDHPNGMCVMEPVIDDDITDQLADWVNGKETKKTKGIDKFADLLGYDKDELAKSLLKTPNKPKVKPKAKPKVEVIDKVEDVVDKAEDAVDNIDEFNKWFSNYKKNIQSAIDSGDYIQLIDSLSDKVHNEIGKTVEKYFDELYDHDYFTNEDFVKYLLSDDVIDGVDVSSVENKVKKLFESETGKKLGDTKGSIFNKFVKSDKLEKVDSAVKKVDIAELEKDLNEAKKSSEKALSKAAKELQLGKKDVNKIKKFLDLKEDGVPYDEILKKINPKGSSEYLYGKLDIPLGLKGDYLGGYTEDDKKKILELYKLMFPDEASNLSVANLNFSVTDKISAKFVGKVMEGDASMIKKFKDFGIEDRYLDNIKFDFSRATGLFKTDIEELKPYIDKVAKIEDELKDLKKNGLASDIVADKTVKNVEKVTLRKKSIDEMKKDFKKFMSSTEEEDNKKIAKLIKSEKSIFAKFDDRSIEALDEYTGGPYEKINRWLRKSKTKFDASTAKREGLSDRLVKILKILDEDMENSRTKEDMVLRRGTDYGDLVGLFMDSNDFMKDAAKLEEMTAEELNDAFKGSQGVYKGFTSTSSVYSRGFSGSVEVIIDAPEGTKGISVLTKSAFKDEEGEFLLAPGTKVECVGIEKSEDYHKDAFVKVFLRIVS